MIYYVQDYIDWEYRLPTYCFSLSEFANIEGRDFIVKLQAGELLF